tara:strand:+ start:319 stop:678 length:360 start_codon:yes stop_codon:yes gene_type:complete
MELLKYLSTRKNKSQLNCIYKQLDEKYKEDYRAWLSNKSRFVSPKESTIFDVEIDYKIDYLRLIKFSNYQLHVMAYIMDMKFEDINKIKTLEQIKVAREKRIILKEIELLKLKLVQLEK